MSSAEDASSSGSLKPPLNKCQLVNFMIGSSKSFEGIIALVRVLEKTDAKKIREFKRDTH